jgi:hypothetical protein
MAALVRVAFRGVPREQRVLIGGAMSGHLMVQMLHRDPGLAGNLVMAAPIPPQPGLSALVMAFLRFRRMTHPLDRPDPQIMHHLYGFLRAHLPPGLDKAVEGMAHSADLRQCGAAGQDRCTGAGKYV